MSRTSVWTLASAVAAMAGVVVLSNVLVQFPVEAQLGRLNLADLLTWGAFSYPLAFLVTDLTNRRFGASVARRVVAVGFAAAILMSFAVSTPRIAVASASAFLVGQWLDVTLFDRLRRSVSWWTPPLVGSVAGSVADTAVFFSLAFAPVFAFVAAGDPFAAEGAPLLGLLPLEAPRWISWAAGDLTVKLAFAALLLAPYRLLMGIFWPLPGVAGPRTARAA